jgi:hypothetical protein
MQLAFLSVISAGALIVLYQLVGSIIYDVRMVKARLEAKKHPYSKILRTRPKVNIYLKCSPGMEEVRQSLLSIVRSSYRKYEVNLVVDGRAKVVVPLLNEFKRRYPSKKISVATGNLKSRPSPISDNEEFILYIESGTIIQRDAISEAVRYFKANTRVHTLSPHITKRFDYSVGSLLGQYSSVIANQLQKPLDVFFGNSIDSPSFVFYRQSTSADSKMVKGYSSSVRVTVNGNRVERHTNVVGTTALIGLFATASYTIYLAFAKHYSALLLLVWSGFCLYLVFNVWLDESLNSVRKLKMFLLAPMVSLLFYAMLPIWLFGLAFSKPIRHNSRMQFVG